MTVGVPAGGLLTGAGTSRPHTVAGSCNTPSDWAAGVEAGGPWVAVAGGAWAHAVPMVAANATIKEARKRIERELFRRQPAHGRHARAEAKP